MSFRTTAFLYETQLGLQGEHKFIHSYSNQNVKQVTANVVKPGFVVLQNLIIYFVH